jgi:hypothetical protein
MILTILIYFTEKELGRGIATAITVDLHAVERPRAVPSLHLLVGDAHGIYHAYLFVTFPSSLKNLRKGSREKGFSLYFTTHPLFILFW